MTTSRFNALPAGTKAYIAFVVVAGMATIAQSTYDLIVDPVNWTWTILAILTLVSGSATVRLPSLPATISVSETFVFTSVLLFGTSAGTITVALDALVISFWSYRKGYPLYKIVFNVCALPLSLWIAGNAFFAYAPFGPLFGSTSTVDLKILAPPLLLFTVLYFGLNSWIIALAIALEKRLRAYAVWRHNFVWLSLNYFGGASVATLLVSYTRDLEFTHIAVIIPLLVVLYFTFSMSWGRVEDANRHLSQLNKLYMSTIETLAMAIDAKDQITHGHIRRVQHFALGLAKELGVDDANQLNAIEAASLLHDMGKLAVPEYILNKPGPLTPAEFEKMKLHAAVGADILSSIEFPYPVVPIVRHHHENWDGTGYPDGLRGSEIPIGARILSVVDCFDALTSDRPYRPRLSDSDALRILRERRGSMYDPLIVDTFTATYNRILPTVETVHQTAKGLSAIASGNAIREIESSGARLDEISASREEMLVLYELARGLSGHLDLADAADVISKHLRRIVPASTCVFYVYDADTDELVAAHASGEHASHFTNLRIARGQRLSGWVAANRQTILNSDPVLDLGEVARVVKPRLRSCLSTPLVTDEQLVGVLTVYSIHRDAFTEDHKRISEVVGRQVSHTVRQAVTFQTDRNKNLRDHLTGLPNTQHLERFVAAELAAGSASLPLSFILIDVDALKSINRNYGRDVGDQGLGLVADAIRRVLRGADILFRYTSDEFVVLLTQTDAEGAEAVAMRISDSVAEQLLSVPEGEIRLRASVGVATAPRDGKTVDSLVNKAREHGQSLSIEHRRVPPSVH